MPSLLALTLLIPGLTLLIPGLTRDLLARRSTPWTFRTTEGIPSRGTPLRFAPFRPLPFRNAPSDDVAAVGPSPYPCAGVHKPSGGYPFRRPRFSSLLSPVFKDETRF